MVKILFLQSVYGIVDETMEMDIYSNIRFINFLDYPETVPDARTIWLFRERLSTTGKDKALWKEVWNQFSDKGITVKKGQMVRCSHDWSNGGFQARHEMHSLQYQDTEEEVTYWINEIIKERPSYGTRMYS